MNKDSVLNGVLIDGLKDLSAEESGSHMRGFFRNIKIRICEHTKKSPQQRSTITTRKIQKKLPNRRPISECKAKRVYFSILFAVIVSWHDIRIHECRINYYLLHELYETVN